VSNQRLGVILGIGALLRASANTRYDAGAGRN
jgi:hypothetical protein